MLTLLKPWLKEDTLINQVKRRVINWVPEHIILPVISPIKKLQEKLNESCILAIIKENMRYTLYQESSTHALEVITDNEEKHLYLTATGRVMLACMDHQKRGIFIEKYGLPEEIGHTARLISESIGKLP